MTLRRVCVFALVLSLSLAAIGTCQPPRTELRYASTSLTEGTENFSIPHTSTENVTFFCDVLSGDQGLTWQFINIQGQPIQLQREDVRNDVATQLGIFINDFQVNSSQLIATERTRQSLRELEISCIAVAIDVEVFPTFLVQTYGPLSSPSGIVLVGLDVSDFNCSWTKPVVPSGVNLTSHVEVTNMTSGEMVRYDTSREWVTFSQSGECSEFNITVFSSDEFVESEIGVIVVNIPLSPDISPVESTLNPTVNLTSGVSIILSFCPADVCSLSYPVVNYTVTLLPTDQSNGTSVTIDAVPEQTTQYSCNPLISVTLDSSNGAELFKDQERELTVTTCSNITCKTTNTITAYTTGVQSPVLYYINRTLLLTCDFTRGSTASGCMFNFTGTLINGTMERYNLTRNSSVSSSVCVGSRACMCVTTENLPTTYTSIRVFTMENDNTVSDISLPVTLNNSRNHEEILRECFPAPRTDEEEGLSGGGIAAIVISLVIAPIVGVLFVILIVYVVWKVRKEKSQESERHVLADERRALADERRALADERRALVAGEGVRTAGIGGPGIDMTNIGYTETTSFLSVSSHTRGRGGIVLIEPQDGDEGEGGDSEEAFFKLLNELRQKQSTAPKLKSKKHKVSVLAYDIHTGKAIETWDKATELLRNCI